MEVQVGWIPFHDKVLNPRYILKNRINVRIQKLLDAQKILMLQNPDNLEKTVRFKVKVKSI